MYRLNYSGRIIRKANLLKLCRVYETSLIFNTSSTAFNNSLSLKGLSSILSAPRLSIAYMRVELEKKSLLPVIAIIFTYYMMIRRVEIIPSFFFKN